jgi:hypothetical protein
MAGKEVFPTNNSMVLNILQMIRAVKSFAAEAKLDALFIDAKMAVSMHRAQNNTICARNMEAHVRCTTSECQRFEEMGREIGFPCSQERHEETSK